MKELRLQGRVIVTGRGSLQYLHEVEGKRVFIVTGQKAMFDNGTIKKIEDIFKSKKCEIEIFSGIQANPTTEEVDAGVKRMNQFKPDLLIAVGGGSVIDASKVMVVFYENPDRNFANVFDSPLSPKRDYISFVAIPSTSGTGSEVTGVAVITFKEKEYKLPIKTKAMIPDISILDADVVMSMSPRIVAETGMDAITHALECFINKNIDDFTDGLSKSAVEGLFKYLPVSYEKGDPDSRERVHNFQCMAGCAFGNAGLGMSHGISHSIGGKFNYGHGLLNAICLPYVLEYNRSKDKEVAERLDYLAKRLGLNDIVIAVNELNRKLQIPKTFEQLGIKRDVFKENLTQLLKNSLQGPTTMNPVQMNEEEMEKVLWTIFDGKLKF